MTAWVHLILEAELVSIVVENLRTPRHVQSLLKKQPRGNQTQEEIEGTVTFPNHNASADHSPTPPTLTANLLPFHGNTP